MTIIRSIAPSFFEREHDGTWRLIGQTCMTCGETLFGRQDVSCLRCGSPELAECGLSDRGTIWSFTVLRNPPPGQRQARGLTLPCPLGLVEIEDARLRILTPLTIGVDELRIDLPVILEATELFVDADDVPVFAFSFRKDSSD